MQMNARISEISRRYPGCQHAATLLGDLVGRARSFAALQISRGHADLMPRGGGTRSFRLCIAHRRALKLEAG